MPALVAKSGSPRWIAALEEKLLGAPKLGMHAPLEMPVGPLPDAPRAAKDLPRSLTHALRDAQEVERSDAPEGREHILTEGEARRFEALMQQVPEARLARVADLLERLGGDARGVESGSRTERDGPSALEDARVSRAIFVRAVLARASALAKSDAPLRVLDRFAGELHGLDADTILARSTVLDLDSRANDHLRDPIALSDKRGVIYPRNRGDVAADNDGLFQRFTASCGPTVIEMMLAQADPVFAFALHKSNIKSSAVGDAAARFQENLLEEYGGIAIGHPDAQLRARFHNALGRLVGEKKLTVQDAGELRAHVERNGPLTKDAALALDLMRARFDGFPQKGELADLRRHKIPTRDEGIGTDALGDAIARLIGPLTGTYYRPTNPPWGFARGGAWRHVDNAARALRRGIDVPFGISEPAHWMLMTAVRGRKPNRSFLVSDPAGGRTAWVTERDFVRGTFTRNQFHLCTGKERGYVDVLFLPQN